MHTFEIVPITTSQTREMQTREHSLDAGDCAAGVSEQALDSGAVDDARAVRLGLGNLLHPLHQRIPETCQRRDAELRYFRT